MEPTEAPPTPLPQLVSETWELVVTYVKQETLVPLSQLKRWIGFGVAGSILLGFGVLFLAMSGLRALQTETGDAFDGNWSWVPYAIVVVVLGLGGGLALKVASARKESR